MFGLIFTLIIAVGLGGTMLAGVSSLRSCGNAAAEADLLAGLVQEEAQRADALQEAAEGANAAQAESDERLRAAQVEVERSRARIANLIEDGGGTICPADCQLPPLE